MNKRLVQRAMQKLVDQNPSRPLHQHTTITPTTTITPSTTAVKTAIPENRSVFHPAATLGTFTGRPTLTLSFIRDAFRRFRQREDVELCQFGRT